ncbi:hypothetical protein G7068_06680 [Leucobacter viscericola]|uniref:Uncharacterized protein n=1 Tax=Leucobacter viscericola TaxID=2714935 RepID=A0A6G7XEP7_9MICO|nr:hypothetical protein [Leucobacter viscericola]QIK62919.1 hypothetical protein G7068_06680 [Leucobacter viscericola]
MSDIKPVTNFFGGYPNSANVIAECIDPVAMWHLLRENLMVQLSQRPSEVLTERIIAQDRSGRKRIQKLTAHGWTIQSATPRRMLRGDVYIFMRPQTTREEREFLGWNK